MLIEKIFVIIWEMFYERISLNSAPFEWIQVGIGVYIPHWKCQVKPHSSPWFSAACATAIVYRNHFFVCTKRINLLNPKESSSMLVIVVKGFLKLTNLHMLIKQKNPSLLRNLALGTFGELQIVFSAKVNLLCLLHLIKENGLLENFLRTQTLIIFISLYLLSLLELIWNCIIFTNKKVITNLDSSKASGPDCIPVVVLKNYEHELSYILSELFNKCLKESCFPDCWRVSSVVPVFKNVGERSTAKNYHPVSLLSLVSKLFEKTCK